MLHRAAATAARTAARAPPPPPQQRQRRHHKQLVEAPIDPDEYAQSLRNKNTHARRVVAKLVKHKEHLRPIFNRRTTGTTTGSEAKRSDDLENEDAELRIHIDKQADASERQRLALPGLLELGNSLASEAGSHPWAIVNREGLRMLERGRSYVPVKDLRNASAIKEDATIRPGCVMELRTSLSKDLIGYGLCAELKDDPDSTCVYPIVLTKNETNIDSLFWNNRIRLAIARRAELLNTRHTSAYRLINGVHDRMPGLYVDYVAECAYITLHPEATGMLPTLLPFLVDDLQVKHVHITDTYGNSSFLDSAPGAADRLSYLENAVPLRVHNRAISTAGGFSYICHRPARAFVKALAKGKTMLDLYSGVASFAAHALAGGATYVHAVDSKAGVLKTAAENLALNCDGDETRFGISKRRVENWITDEHDRRQEARRGQKQKKGSADDTAEARPTEYDIVVADPTEGLVRSAAKRAGRDVIESEDLRHLALPFAKGLSMVSNGGFFLPLTHTRDLTHAEYCFVLRLAARKAGRRVQIIRGLHSAADFPHLLTPDSGPHPYMGSIVRVFGEPEARFTTDDLQKRGSRHYVDPNKVEEDYNAEYVARLEADAAASSA
eukprot:Rhum_TRINITY_DN972_c0_g1::Rhum_TRINITY_DN972_c0_g1_i1::g.2903::m.2903/K06969/rlmI; 23S rRNA (cytosine1962-C5)-methyltransferase